MDRQEAIKIVKSNLPEGRQMLSEALEFLIPELAESEDEKIRKGISYVLNNADYSLIDNTDFTVSEMEYWLEKQGEQKPAETEKGAKGNERKIPNSAWSEEDEEMLNSFLHKLEVCDLLSNKENVWAVRKLKSLKDRCVPQKQWKPSDEQINSLYRVLRFYGKGSSVYDTVKELEVQLKKLKEGQL